MKKNKLLKVLLITLMLVVFATWFIPQTSISELKLTTGEYGRVGLFKLSTNLIIALQNFFQYSLYLLAVGGFYGVVYKLNAYKKLINKITDGFSGKEWMFFVAVGLFFAITSSMAGLSLALMILVPFVVSVVLGLGYNKMTAAMLTVGSILSGLMGTVFSFNNVAGVTTVFKLENTNAFVNGDVLFKVLIMALSLAVVLVGTLFYGNKNKENPVKLEVEDKKTKCWPLVVGFDLLVIVLILGFISWETIGVDIFDRFVTALANPTGGKFTKGLIGAFNAILGVSANFETGDVTSFGRWTLIEGSAVILVAVSAIALMYRVKFDDFLDNFLVGAKKALKPALLVFIPYTILITISNSGIANGLLGSLMEFGKGVSLIPMSIVSMGMSALGVETYASAMFGSSYILASGAGASLTLPEMNLIGLLWQSMYGLVMFIAPTSLVLISILSYLEVSYKEWLKSIWKIVLILYVITVVVLYIYK